MASFGAAGEDSPWWMRYGARGLGCGGGIIALGLGVFACLSVTASCIVAGVWQMVAAFIVIAAEAPFCCTFVEIAQPYSNFVESRPRWQKAVLYVLVSLPAVILCASFSTIIGSGLLFVCGIFYGLMAIGKKGERGDMLAASQQNPAVPNSSQSALVDDPGAWHS